jgi:rhomboid protease GluP
MMPEADGVPPDRPGLGARLAQAARAAPVTTVLVVANLLVFVTMAAAGGGVFRPNAGIYPGFGSNFGPLTTDGQWWRLGASVFIHFGLLHIAMNMIALWELGRLVESLYGSAAFGLVYCVSGLAGSLASVAWHPWVHSAGASGAIFGILGALLAYALKPGMGLPPATLRAHRTAAVLFIGYSLAFGLIGEGIDNAAHLGGLAGGIVLGFILGRPETARRQSIDARRALAAASVAALLLGAIGTRVENTGPAFREEEAFRLAYERFVEIGRPLEVAIADGFTRWRRGELPDDVLIARLDAERMHLERSLQELRQFRLDPRAPTRLAEVQATLVQVLPLQRDAYTLLAKGVRTRDPRLLREANAKRDEVQMLMRYLAPARKR